MVKLMFLPDDYRMGNGFNPGNLVTIWANSLGDNKKSIKWSKEF